MNIIDFSQIVSAVIYMGDAHECAKHPSEASKNVIKHSVFESIRYNHLTHSTRYGKTVLACDSGSWRYGVFPQYKHLRKLKREKDTSGINWAFVNAVKAEIISDLDTYFPFPVISIRDVEGDDIIGVLTKHVTETSKVTTEDNIFGGDDPEDILITSTDGDNYQLHALGKHIKQWSPASKKLVRPEDTPRNELIRKIVKGDSGDGVPNIKSGDNVFVDGIRQKPISEKYLQTFFDAKNPIDACLTVEESINYMRNEKLVSYSKIPDHIQDSILLCYNEKCSKKIDKMKLMNYFVDSGFSNLYGNITDFFA